MEKKRHRRVWIEAFGPIPKDANGRSYEIHHRNGNHNDNRLENLQCVTIEEHLRIHLEQGDWGAVAAISRRLGVAVEVQRELNSIAGKSAKERQLGWHDPDLKEYFREGARKGGRAHKGMKWFNNGEKSTKALQSPGDGWVEGRLIGKTKFGYEKGRKIGFFWHKDGVNKRSVECPGEGWTRGKFLTEEQRERRRETLRKARDARRGVQ